MVSEHESDGCLIVVVVEGQKSGTLSFKVGVVESGDDLGGEEGRRGK